MEKMRYMISDAASKAGVETHVLRYWEDELDLTIPRNEMGHRYYTRENIKEFQKIKELKEKGYQLKAIRTIIHNNMDLSDLPPLPQPNTTPGPYQPTAPAAPEVQDIKKPQPDDSASEKSRTEKAPAAVQESQPPVNQLSAEERMAQFRELMSDIVGHAIAQNNEELSLSISQEVRETLLKEMNYLFREQEDAEEERYKKLDAAIRGKLRKKHSLFSKKEKAGKKHKQKVNAAVPTT